MNYNRFLENAHRSDVIGRNIYTMGRKTIYDYKREMAILPSEAWDTPDLGLPGIVAVGHQIDVADLLTLKISVNGNLQHFTPVRNRWTPAWMETYYRSAVEADYYPKSGTLCLKETKCFLDGDTFLAELTLFNDRRKPMEVEASLCVPFTQIQPCTYRVEANILPGSLGRPYKLEGVAVAAMENYCGQMRLTIPANGSVVVRYAFAFEPADDKAAWSRVKAALREVHPFQQSEDRFNTWVEQNVPVLKTDNVDILKIYYYRYFVIYRGIHTPRTIIPDHDFTGECVYESPFGYWFGAPVGLSVPLQVEEMKWMKKPGAVYSQLRNWKNDAGNSRGYIQATPMAVWNLYTVRGDDSILEEMYEACRGYALWKCDPSDPGKLPVQTGSWGTGAEYQPSFYQFTEPQYDWRHDNELSWQGYPHTKLHRVDECVLHAANLTACARMAQKLGREDDRAMLENHAQKTMERILKLFWNEEKQFFFDCDPDSLRQCDESRCYDGFFPLLWKLAGKEYRGVFDHLKPGGPFTADFPVASVDKQSPMYWFDNCIAGPTASSVQDPHYYECCWNGPTWPFATSFVLEALGGAAEDDGKWIDLWLDLFERYTQLHFAYGDRSLPRIAEHYRSTDGASFSPYHEYFHSTWISLFMRYWAGIHVEEGKLVFEPLTNDSFTLEGVWANGVQYRLQQYRKDGKLVREVNCV